MDEFEVKKNIDVKAIRKHLAKVSSFFRNADEKVQATLVLNENYSSLTAIVEGKVLCINFMN